jgi:ABC-type arginine transport system permease subunit
MFEIFICAVIAIGLWVVELKTTTYEETMRAVTDQQFAAAAAWEESSYSAENVTVENEDVEQEDFDE